jgi:hypothetical protein
MSNTKNTVLHALARATTEARTGNTSAIAIIAVSPDGVPDITFGGESELIPSVNIGLDLLKAHLVNQAMAAQAQKPPAIVRPDAVNALDS